MKNAATYARRVKFDTFYAGFAQQFQNTRTPACQAAIHIVAHEHVGRRSTVRDDDWTSIGSPLGTADVLVEFATGDSNDCHSKANTS